jgi:hypothetical protein
MLLAGTHEVIDVVEEMRRDRPQVGIGLLSKVRSA